MCRVSFLTLCKLTKKSSLLPPKILCCLHAIRGTMWQNLVYLWVYLPYFVNLIHLEDFFNFIWSASNNWMYIIEKLYSCLLSPMRGLFQKWQEISNILFTKYGHERAAELFLNSIKCKQCLKIVIFVVISWYHMWRLW